MQVLPEGRIMSKKTKKPELLPPEFIFDMVMISTHKKVEPLAKALAELYKELYKNPSKHGLRTFDEKIKEGRGCL